MEMAMISMNDLFYGEREAVQILKDDNREILEIIHRYNYFYTEPPPLSDVDLTSDSEEEDLESNWSEVAQSVPDSADDKKDTNSEGGKSVVDQSKQKESPVALKVPMCCAECEETVTLALKSVAGNQPVAGNHSSTKHRSIFTLIGIFVIGGIVMLTAIVLHL